MQRLKEKKNVEHVYNTFITRVANGRNMNKTTVDAIGQGRVWSGYDAKSIGLVDTYGGIEKAVDIAVLLAKIEDYRIIEKYRIL